MTADHTPGEALRVSVHETGHAVMAHTLGRGVELLSIRPGEHHDGVCTLAPMAVELPRSQAWRRQIEHEILIRLAGHIAEVSWVYPDTEASDPTEPDVVEAARLAERAVRVPLTRTQFEALEETERTEAPSDAEYVRRLAEILTPRAEAFLQWMHEETWEEVRSERFMVRLRAVAPVLLRERTMTGAAFGDIVRYADRGFPIGIAARK